MSSWGLVSYKVVSYKIKWVYTPLPVPATTFIFYASRVKMQMLKHLFVVISIQNNSRHASYPTSKVTCLHLQHLHVLILWNVKNNAVYSYRQYYIAKHKTLPAYIIISRQPLIHFLSNKEKNKEKGYLKRQVFTSDKVFFYERYKRGLEWTNISI